MLNEMPTDDEQLFSVQRLSRDLRVAAEKMTDAEARFLVDAYYTMQKQRIRNANQHRQASEGKEPAGVLSWLTQQSGVLERQVHAALDRYTMGHQMGSWMRDIYGIGPIISAGLLSHIDITKAPTVGHIWRFAGLDPTVTWSRGETRPWNARLKVVCWHAGECFKRFSKRDECYYGKLYVQRKEYEIARNDRGGNAEAARETLAAKRISDAATKAIYESGKLPPGRLDLRATRWAVKQFLADMHGEWYRREFGKDPPLPYPIAHLGHAHVRKAPH